MGGSLEKECRAEMQASQQLRCSNAISLPVENQGLDSSRVLWAYICVYWGKKGYKD